MVSASVKIGPHPISLAAVPFTQDSIYIYIRIDLIPYLQAILGAQMVITLVMVSVIQKLSPHFSLAKWLLCSTGLTRYLHPTDNELKTLAGV